MSSEPIRPSYNRAASDRARREAEQAAALEAVKRAFGFGTCIVVKTVEAPLLVTRLLVKKKSGS